MMKIVRTETLNTIMVILFHPSLKVKSPKHVAKTQFNSSSSAGITPSSITHTFLTHTSTNLPSTQTSQWHPPNDKGFSNCAVHSWAAMHGEIEMMSTKSIINKDKYQYLHSSLKHAQTQTHTCLMVLLPQLTFRRGRCRHIDAHIAISLMM